MGLRLSKKKPNISELTISSPSIDFDNHLQTTFDALKNEQGVITFEAFLKFIEIKKEFCRVIFEMISSDGVAITYEDLKNGLDVLFYNHFVEDIKQDLDRRRSVSLSRFYAIDDYPILFYLYFCSLVSKTITAECQRELHRFWDIQWHERDEKILIEKSQLMILMESAGSIAMRALNGYKLPKYFRNNEIANDESALIQKLVNSVTNNKDYVSLRGAFDWFKRNNQQFFNVIIAHIYQKVFPGYQKVISMIPEMQPSKIVTAEEMWLLSTMLPFRYIKNYQSQCTRPTWTMLFNTDDNGHSISQFEYYCFDYPAPTILLIHGEKMSTSKTAVDSNNKTLIYGAYIATPWKKIKTYWGNTEFFLFKLSPYLEVYPAVLKPFELEALHEKHGKNAGTARVDINSADFITFNPSKGIGMGGNVRNEDFMLRIDNFLQRGKFQSSSPSNTYRPSVSRMFSYQVDIVRIEVWGLGGQAAFDHWAREKKFTDNNAEHRRNVNIKDEEVDRMLLEMAGHEFHPEERKPID